MPGRFRAVDLRGARYGSLVVIDLHDYRDGKLRWLCKCDCGNLYVAGQGKLNKRKDGVRSCGLRSNHPRPLRETADVLREANKKIFKQPNGCWIWTGAFVGDGYGVLNFRRKRYRAHRLLYELLVGPIPEGLLIRHSCDNPPCVNPDHLSIGTQKDNMRDCGERFRNGRKFKPEDVLDMRSQFLRASRRDGTVARLAKEYGIPFHAVWRIVRGVSWKHGPWPEGMRP